MAPTVVESFPKESVLYDSFNFFLQTEDETIWFVNIRTESEPTIKDWC